MTSRLLPLARRIQLRSFHISCARASEKVIFLDDQALKHLVPLSELPEGNTGPVIRSSKEAEFGCKRIGCVTLPQDLIHNVKRLIDRHPDKRLIRTDALRLYEALRSTARFPNEDQKSKPSYKKKDIDTGNDALPEAKVITYGPREAVAYAAGVMPATFASITNVLSELHHRLSDFHPRSILDFGTGPGTGLWAAKQTFTEINAMTGVDISEDMLRVAEALGEHHIPATFQRHLTYDPLLPGHDLVLSAYTLGDIGSLALQESTVMQLWQQTSDVLVLIERGTPVGFSTIARARQWILDHEQNAHVVAPCPHDRPCPLLFSEFARPRKFWCHFSQRVQRPNFLMKTKHSKNNTEDSKYSYVILRKGPRPMQQEDNMETQAYTWPRLIQPPLKKNKHVVMDTCASNGAIQRMVIAKSQGKVEYRDARKSAWGDAFPHPSKNKVVTRFEPVPLLDELASSS
ncbi:Rsm22-domain-containing protein [Hesseltinella vesiculosa]|uniref:Rsm22-domain-containing protein n=1 Tax=Hesseltinella vesiculosa TaxID=101127 RepID=A0A1X2G756_9FUNG|nr:Rsm22-domain-containing protein [Hesseltinella vesiculosa]